MLYNQQQDAVVVCCGGIQGWQQLLVILLEPTSLPLPRGTRSPESINCESNAIQNS